MEELLSVLWTEQVQQAVAGVIIFLVILYVLSIIWVIRDAYLRGTVWYVWAIVALVPLLGVIAYCLLRPPLLQIDRDEQELEVALKQRQLQQYGECANCGYPVEADYVLCPNCHNRLKNQCGTCGKALDPAWTVCPYCATPLPGIAARRSGRTAIPGQGGASGRPAAGAPARGAEENARPAGGHARQ
ncbi:MAG: zinc ribbon domain-containing protein [Eggerthellales bacterium]|nr:zinc ribbon domain-containing protein [Eggerthellales bacterium]